jgi:hypothetical protein
VVGVVQRPVSLLRHQSRVDSHSCTESVCQGQVESTPAMRTTKTRTDASWVDVASSMATFISLCAASSGDTPSSSCSQVWLALFRSPQGGTSSKLVPASFSAVGGAAARYLLAGERAPPKECGPPRLNRRGGQLSRSAPPSPVSAESAAALRTRTICQRPCFPGPRYADGPGSPGSHSLEQEHLRSDDSQSESRTDRNAPFQDSLVVR